jgi:hypothetical protein
MIEERFDEQVPSVQACYEDALGAAPELTGRWTLTYTVQQFGHTTHAAMAPHETTEAHPVMEACVEQAVSRMAFDPISMPVDTQRNVFFHTQEATAAASIR